MEGVKRKRVRKRPRRTRRSGEEHDDQQSDQEQEVPVETSTKSQKGMVSTEPSVQHEPPAQANLSKDGPSLSFYERTNPHKPSALDSLIGGQSRRYTVSVALPGSIILNAQSPELQSRLAGHIARCCAIFNVDEIVVFDEGQSSLHNGDSWEREAFEPQHNDHARRKRWDNDEENGQEFQGGSQEGPNRGGFDPNAYLARILQYVETPQYLRKALFPMHRDLRLAGLLPPLDCPHHLRFQDQSPYREGIIVEAPHWARNDALTWVNVGLRDPIGCALRGTSRAEDAPIGARVTVRMPTGGQQKGHLVPAHEPVEKDGLYWGYAVRLAGSLADAISSSSFHEAYDLVIGTSERGQSLSQTLAEAQSVPTSFKRALIVLGGLSGLEDAVERDPSIHASADEASELFDLWLNVVEGQGSRTVRTEEALLITLARLKTLLEDRGAR